MNQFIEEDFERILDLDSIYIYEKLIEEEQEYYEFEKNRNRLPAKIEIIKHLNYGYTRIKTKTFGNS